jgi:subtilisin family serine protease
VSKRILLVLALAGVVAAATPGQARPAPTQAPARDYVVLYAKGASLASARLAVRAAGGTVVRENRAVGVATAASFDPRFEAAARAQAALAGVAPNLPVGRATDVRPAARPARAQVRRVRAAPTAEPLAGLQWDMAMIGATVNGSYAKEPGKRGVLVGILDTGVDGTHPDLAPNFDASLSRNFVTDMPDIDGPCEHPSCVDPVNEDDEGHGTHVAGIIGAALNGLGTAGVAPNVTLVNIRAGQDSGFFFLQPTVDALTYAANIGVDVVNMSYFIDPWLYNCVDNPADSPQAQAEQRTIIEATQRALDYAHLHGVTLIAALGNENTNLDSPSIVDTTSPDFPDGAAYTRTVDQSCIDLPTEGRHVIAVGAVGPSTRKADYSNWGLEQNDVTAPGGWFRDGLGTPTFRTPGNEILSTYPQSLAIASGQLNPDGTPNTPFVVRDCEHGVCAYYQYLQGTSMAAPHAVGVAALIVSRFGVRDLRHGGLTLPPAAVEAIMRTMATDHPCPVPPTISYVDVGRPTSFDAVCTGTTQRNSIWGDGIVNALASVTLRKQ